MVFCENCDRLIDTDFDVHFNSREFCYVQETKIIGRLNKIVDDISCGELELSRDYKKELIKLL